MAQNQRSRNRLIRWLRWLVATVLAISMSGSVYCFLSERLQLWEAPPYGQPIRPLSDADEWQRNGAWRFWIVVGDHELLRDDNLEGRDTRPDIKRWANLLYCVRSVVPLVCGVIVLALVYVAGGFVVPSRKHDETET